MGTLAFGLVLLAVSVLAGALTLVPQRQAGAHGREVVGTVERVYPAGVNNYPPYGAWDAHLDVRYELDERRRRAAIWLSETKEADYYPGQRIGLVYVIWGLVRVATG
jgi:regulator of protease activity HflC (stomatin/prohibitin superfamily)